jgi:hypothetical protein
MCAVTWVVSKRESLGMQLWNYAFKKRSIPMLAVAAVVMGDFSDRYSVFDFLEDEIIEADQKQWEAFKATLPE